MKLNTLLALLLTSVFSSSLHAENEAPRWYQFEIIIFKYTNPIYTDSELWPDDPGMPQFEQQLALISNIKEEQSQDNTQLPPALDQQDTIINYQVVPHDELQLKNEANKINFSSRRKLLLHAGWLQAMYPYNKAMPVAIKLGPQYKTLVAVVDDGTEIPLETSNTETNNANIATASINQTEDNADTIDSTQETIDPESGITVETETLTRMEPQIANQLDGFITVSISRFLHVWTDLVYTRPEVSPTNFNDDPEIVNVKKFRHKDHRKMRSKELHYIDNPSFGILIYALPYKSKEEVVN